MSWLLFMDESGHDHVQLPYEVRGGFAMHISRLWPFVRAMKQLEFDAFGAELALYQSEIKGSKLLKPKRFKFAGQHPRMHDEERRALVRSLLTKGLENRPPIARELTAYGQASLMMVDGTFQLLGENNAQVFASAIPRGVQNPGGVPEHFLRKDHVFLLERYFYHLETERQHGLLVMDEVDKTQDRRFVNCLERYYTQTSNGRFRSSLVVPSPFFVSSDMSYAVQAADLVIYCINWGFRIPRYGMNAPVRNEIADRYGNWLGTLQYRSNRNANGEEFETFGITYVSDPYTARD